MHFVKADLHIHTREDPQGIQRHSVEELILKGERLGYSVLSVTNKNSVTYSKELAAFARKRGILLIPGIEANISGKEVLILNHRGKIPTTFDELRELRKKKKDVLVIAPHPYYILQKCLKDDVYTHADVFDAIEYSHFHLSFYNPNRKAEIAARKLKKPLLANSDAHQIDQFGDNFTWLQVKNEMPAVADVIDAVRSGRAHFIADPISFLRFVFVCFKVATVKINNPIRRKYREWDDRRKGRPPL